MGVQFITRVRVIWQYHPYWPAISDKLITAVYTRTRIHQHQHHHSTENNNIFDDTTTKTPPSDIFITRRPKELFKVESSVNTTARKRSSIGLCVVSSLLIITDHCKNFLLNDFLLRAQLRPSIVLSSCPEPPCGDTSGGLDWFIDIQTTLTYCLPDDRDTSKDSEDDDRSEGCSEGEICPAGEKL